MAQDSNNPFVLPGFGQQGEAAQNPLFAGLEMMNQAWQGLAKGGQANAVPTMSTEDLDKKISELQTVHNWLQLNVTMLANTIQGLEIQRSTLSMMKSFAAAATDEKSSADPANNEYAQAAGEWWNLLQQQFEQITEATAASLQSMASAAEETAPVKKAAKTKTASKKPAKPAASKTAAKTTAKKTRKT